MSPAEGHDRTKHRPDTRSCDTPEPDGGSMPHTLRGCCCHTSYDERPEAGGMPGKPFVMDWVREDTEAALEAAYRAESDGKRRMHLLGL